MGNICKNDNKPKTPKEKNPVTKRNKHCVTTQHMDLDDHSIFVLISENKIPSKIKENASPIEKIKSALNFLSFALSNSESNIETFKMENQRFLKIWFIQNTNFFFQNMFLAPFELKNAIFLFRLLRFLLNSH